MDPCNLPSNTGRSTQIGITKDPNDHKVIRVLNFKWNRFLSYKIRYVCKELGSKYYEYQCDGVSSSISGSYVGCTRGLDKSSECGSTCHTARDGTEVVQEAQLQYLSCEEETYKKRYESDKSTPEEDQAAVYLERINELSAAFDTCTDKEENETELLEDTKEMLLDLHADVADLTEVTEYQCHDQGTAGSTEVECGSSGKGDVDASYKKSHHESDSKSTETELIKLKKLGSGTRCCLELTYGSELGSLFIHIDLEEPGDDLYEQYYTDNSKGISYCVSYCDLTVVRTFLADGALSSSEGRCTCK